MMRRPIMAVMVVAALASCQRDASDGELAEISGKIFVFNYRVARATYLVTLRKRAPFPEGAFAEATFEDPRGGPPLITREKLFPVMDKIVLESPAVHCVRKGRPYSVTIRLVGSNNEELQTFETTIASNVDQSILPAKPLTIGPLYDRNPEVFRPDGSTDFSPDECPA
jgi:hypothetical protein